MEKIKPYLFPVGMFVAALVLAFGWNLSRRARVSAEHDAEQARLALKGVMVATDETDKQLRSDIEKLLSDNDLLRKSYEDAKIAAPGAQPRAVARLSTKPFVIKNLPVAAGEGPTPLPPGGRTEPAATCVLREGDEGSVEATVITLATEEQNLIIAGVAEFYRDTPGPRAKVGEGPFTASLSDIAALAPRPGPRWGFALGGLCQPQGCAPGVALLFPPWEVLGVRLEASAALYGGAFAAIGGQVGARW